MDDDDDFLNELNELSQKIKKEPKLIENSDIITPIKNNIESKEDSKNLLEAKKELEKNINKINEQFKFMNESNPFIEAFNNNNNNNINEKDLSNLFNELELNLNGMNNIMEDFLKKENLSNENNNTNGKDYEMKMFENVLDYLIKFDLLKETILNMKKSINEAFEKNKETLNENEKNKCANLILEEISKSNFDKQKIIDNLYNLQQIAEIENLNII